MRAGRPEPHTLAGAYALDALDGADRTRFERHLARCEQCAREVSGLREATARLAAAAAAEPPPGLTERALAAAARTRQLPPAAGPAPRSAARRAAMTEPAPRSAARRAAMTGAAGRAGARRPGSRLRRSRMPRLALAAAAVILAGAAGAGAHAAAHRLEVDQLRSHAVASVLTARDATILTARVASGGSATILMSRRERVLVFAASGLRALPSSRCYELWLMGPSGDRPAGLLPRPSEGMTGPVVAHGLAAGDSLGLAVEPVGRPRHRTMILLIPL